MTMVAGAKVTAMLAMPSAVARTAALMIDVAAASPAAAAAKISDAGFSSRVGSSRNQARSMAPPPANDSQQPRAPQKQSAPSRAMLMWPNSPCAPRDPVSTVPP